MQNTRVRIAGITLTILVGMALSGCTALGGILDLVAGGGSLSDSSAFAIKVGDCFNEPDLAVNEQVSDVEFVDCTLPHDNEAYASVLMTEVEFPGDAAAGDLGADACGPRFLDFVGASEAYDGEITFGLLYPSQDSWDSGDREILCYAYDLDGETIGTLKNSVG